MFSEGILRSHDDSKYLHKDKCFKSESFIQKTPYQGKEVKLLLSILLYD